MGLLDHSLVSRILLQMTARMFILPSLIYDLEVLLVFSGYNAASTSALNVGESSSFGWGLACPHYRVPLPLCTVRSSIQFHYDLFSNSVAVFWMKLTMTSFWLVGSLHAETPFPCCFQGYCNGYPLFFNPSLLGLFFLILLISL